MHRPARRSPFRPQFDRLEDRSVPAVITVTTLADTVAVDGAVSLREAITSANNNANLNADVVGVGTYGADTIRFNIPGTGPFSIAVTSRLPTLSSSD
jgi:CSLREA domain-containing protein